MSEIVKGTKTQTLISRRKLIQMGLVAAIPAMIPGAAMAAFRVIPKRSRSLSFYNLHTDESLRLVYFENGKYIPGALHEINFILRDWRQNEVKPIDPALLDLLVGIHNRLETKTPFNIVSGYRSPKTNGKAIDICVPGRSLSNVHRAAMSMFGGGVGYYPRTGFVHVDTGRLRYW
jgi:uncharacterized protein YcbK (DUF882 family)